MPEHNYRGQAYQNADGSITLFDLQIAESPDSKERVFVIRTSPFNEGRPISDGLIVDRARKLADHYYLEPQQMRLYAETSDGEFVSCRFRQYSTALSETSEVEATSTRPQRYSKSSSDKDHRILEFSAGEAKFPASKEEVEQHIDRVLTGHKRTVAPVTTKDLETNSLPSADKILKNSSGGNTNSR